MKSPAIGMLTLRCSAKVTAWSRKSRTAMSLRSIASQWLKTARSPAVLIDGEATLKRVFLFDDHIELRAENPAFATIIRIGEAMNTITIEGKAVGLCRKL